MKVLDILNGYDVYICVFVPNDSVGIWALQVLTCQDAVLFTA